MSAASSPPSRRRRVLLGVSGGIAAYKAPELVRRLQDAELEVRVCLTRSAPAFVTSKTLEVLSGHQVYDQSYLAAQGRGDEEHMVAAEWADVLLVAPATAHVLARLARGLADDFLTTTALAFPGPLLAAPAMHPNMWEHPAVQENLEILAGRGVRFIGPEIGPLATGEVGIGRLAEPQVIATAAASLGLSPSLAGRKVVVGAGPTWEPLDPVRFLGNRSSGKMGFALAAEAASRGADVTLVAGPVALATPSGVRRIDVITSEEMRDALVDTAREADLVLMAAAVADYRPRVVAGEKIKKEQGPPVLELEETPDILRQLVALSEGIVVGFAAETEELEAHAVAKLARKGCDYVVANDVSRPDIGFGSDFNEVVVLGRDGFRRALPRQLKNGLAQALLDLFEEALRDRAEATR